MPRSSAQRRATQNSPSSLASVQPTAPAYQPRSRPSSAGISGAAAACGSPPTAGVGCSRPASSIALRGCASWARIGVARCWMFATLISVGLVGGGDPDGVRAQRAGDAADDDRLLLAVLVGAQQLLAEVVVDGGIGGAAGGAGQRDGLGAVAVAADQQLGRGGDEGRVAAAGAEDVTGLRSRRAGRRRPRRRRGRSGAWTVTSRASTIFSNAPARMRSTARATAPS